MNHTRNNFFIFLIIAATFYGCKSPSCKKASKPPIQEPNTVQQLSKEAKSVISSHGLNSSSAYALNVHTNMVQSNNYETVVIPPPAVMSDGFTTIMTIDHKNKLYWIARTGGVAGIYEKGGPFKLEK